MSRVISRLEVDLDIAITALQANAPSIRDLREVHVDYGRDRCILEIVIEQNRDVPGNTVAFLFEFQGKSANATG